MGDPQVRALPPASQVTGAPPVPAPAPISRGAAAPASAPAAPVRVRTGLSARVAAGVVLAEIAVAAVALTAPRRDWTLIPAAVLALVILLLLIPPVGAVAQTRLTYLLRRSPAPPPPSSDPLVTGLRELVPGLSVTSIGMRTGQGLGICFDGTGWTAVLAISRARLQPGPLGPYNPFTQQNAPFGSTGLPEPAGPPSLPLGSLALALTVDDIRFSSVQVITQTCDNPLGLPTDSGLLASYATLNAAGVPAAQQIWVALRLDAAKSVDAVLARGGGTAGAERALKRGAARLVELLEPAGLAVQPMGRDGLLVTLAHLSGLSGTGLATDGSPDGMRRMAEKWRFVGADEHGHVSWQVQQWPAAGSAGSAGSAFSALVAAGAAVPAMSTVTSMALRPLTPAQEPTVQVQTAVRVITRPGQDIEQAATALEQAVRDGAGFRLKRLNGQQKPALIESLGLEVPR